MFLVLLRKMTGIYLARLFTRELLFKSKSWNEGLERKAKQRAAVSAGSL